VQPLQNEIGRKFLLPTSVFKVFAICMACVIEFSQFVDVQTHQCPERTVPETEIEVNPLLSM
jgi:hypothetical protein